MNKELTGTIVKVIGVVAALYLFLVGINGMSSAIKHMGAGVAESIFRTTSNPVVALFIGIFSTVLFQSSSTTTSLIVGMVSSGALSLAGAPAKDKAPLLTIPTINEVVVDELWNKTVEKIPMNKATTGLLVVLNIDSATPAPMCFIADDIPLIPTRNK